MSWSVGNVGTAVFANNADVTPACPVHASGQILFAAAAFRNKTAAAGELISETGSWIQLYDAIGIALFYKVASGSSETDPTFQFAGGASGDTTGGVVFTTTGGSTTVQTSAGLDNSSSTNVSFSGLTISSECLVIDIACVNDNRNFNKTVGWTEIVDSGSALGTDMQMGIQYLSTSLNTSAHVGTISASKSSQTVSIALQVAAASVGIMPILHAQHMMRNL